MSNRNYKYTTFLLINLFIPRSANIASGSHKTGSLLIILSFIIFFLSPYLPLSALRLLFLLLLVTSYTLLFKKSDAKKLTLPTKHIIVILILFIILSVLSLNFTHHLRADNYNNDKLNIVYVLGTKPFKRESTEKMLKMSAKELGDMYNTDIHPLFRRLRTANMKTKGDKNYLLISSCKKHKNIIQKILTDIKEFFSCKTTKEEITKLKKYINENNHENADITIVSDDYHAFRVLHYAKLNNLKNISFYATSYEFSIYSFIKRYFIEQALFILS